ncbi:MAG TPA: response regulator transcription factor, partial [Anaerolineales bacterium]|nr:response regulator transcription factor [Anaerolineales bacterium]
MSHAIRVFITDDHPIVRQGLEVLISAQPDMRLAGQAINGAEAVDKILKDPPDVVVMDLMMPGVNGLTAIRQIRAAGL